MVVADDDDGKKGLELEAVLTSLLAFDLTFTLLYLLILSLYLRRRKKDQQGDGETVSVSILLVRSPLIVPAATENNSLISSSRNGDASKPTVV
jgi:hypothetical protein